MNQEDSADAFKNERDDANVGAESNEAPNIESPGVEAQAKIRESWRQSKERKLLLVLAAGFTFAFLIFVLIGFAIGGASSSSEYDGGESKQLGALAGGLIGIYFAVIGVWLSNRYQRRAWYDRVVILKAKVELDRAEIETSEGDLDLRSLWILNQKRLDYYHGLATSQSEDSFRYGVIAVAIGFLVIVGGGIGALLAENYVASASAAIVGATGGALSAYIGRTFIRMQENSSRQLRAYFSQPLEFSRYLAAERVAAELEETGKAEAQREIIRAIIAGRSLSGETWSSDE